MVNRTTIELKPETKEKLDNFRKNTSQESLSYDNTIQQILVNFIPPILLKEKEEIPKEETSEGKTDLEESEGEE